MTIDEIRKLLSEATPGPMHADREATVFKANDPTCYGSFHTVADAELYAAAPEALTFLLGEVERLKSELEAADFGFKEAMERAEREP